MSGALVYANRANKRIKWEGESFHRSHPRPSKARPQAEQMFILFYSLKTERLPEFHVTRGGDESIHGFAILIR